MGSMFCHECMQPFKSWIRLQYHQSKEHKAKNVFSQYGLTPNSYSKEWKKQHEPIEDIWKDKTGNVGY